MKKFLRTAISLTMVAAMVLATGCGARGGSSDAAEGETIELKLAHIYSTNSNEDKYFNEFKNRVEGDFNFVD